MNTTKQHYLSFYNDQGILTLNAKQFDTGRMFVFDIMDHDEPFDLTGCTASLHIQKADGTQFQGEDCCIVDTTKITINPALGNGAQILAADGVNVCELVLKDSEGLTLTTWDFHINVLKRVHNGENLKSSDAYDVLDKIDKNEKIRKENETLRIQSEETRKANEITRQTNETLRINAEEARKTAESKRQQDTAKAIADAEKATKECIELNHEAESWAHGGTGIRQGEDTDNSKYWCQQSKNYADSWKGSLLPKGILNFAQLPVSGMVAGHLYHINNAFVTDGRFKEGAGYSYPAGTNVYWTQDGKWDCLSGVLTRELTKAEYNALSEAEKMNGTIYYISDADNVVGEATSTEKGLVKVDAALSAASTNPVQNKIVTTGLNDIKDLISGLTTRLNALADSDDTTLDQLSEIVAYIKSNRSLIENVTTSKVNVTDIVDNLTSTAANKPLAAKQGKVLSDLISALTTAVGNKVDKVSGKGLSANDYTTAEKNKLNGIAAGAEVNVQADWNVTDSGSDAFIKNKPTSLKNPAALTFTGCVTGTYDGSSAKSVAIPTSLPASNTTSDYSSTGTAPVNGTAVNKALQTLDVASKGGSGKYIQSISETDGKISAVEANMPTIPTVGNGTVTIKQGGTSKGSFTMNQSGNTTIELTDNNTTYSTATQSANGLMSSADKKKLDGISSGANTYTLPLATSSVRGGVKVGYTANGKNYPVQLSNEQMYVNVPWTDTNTQTITGVKGNAESSYRTGNVNITPANIGLGNVNNTADSIKNVASATKAIQDGNGNNIAETYLSKSGGTVTGKLSVSNVLETKTMYSTTGYVTIGCKGTSQNIPSDGYVFEIDQQNDFVYLSWLSNCTVNANGYFNYSNREGFVLDPATGNFYSDIQGSLGAPTHKWSSVYAANGTIQTSDRSQKNTIKELTNEQAQTFIYNVKPSTYKMNNGTSGRTHWGIISQDIEKLLKELGMTSLDFAGFIKSPKVKGFKTITDESGKKTRVYEYIEDEYDYSLRYDEFIAPIIKTIQVQHDEIESLKKRLELLESKL